MRVERDGNRVRLLSKGGHDWTSRYPWIVESALKIRKRQFIIDGEAVVLDVDGVRTSTPCTPGNGTTTSSSMPSTSGVRWRRSPEAAAASAQAQPGSATPRPGAGHLRRAVRAG